jgi:hypothetical protein
MALFPRIQSPCPYKNNLDAIMAGSACGMCHRQVHDITALSDAERLALVAGCKDEICVSYRVTAKTVLAAATLGAGFGMSGAVAAQPAADAQSLEAVEDPNDYMEIIVGGLKEPKKTVWVDTKRPANLAALPVVYEDAPEQSSPASKQSNGKPGQAK